MEAQTLPDSRGNKTMFGLLLAGFVAFFIWLLWDDHKKRVVWEANEAAVEAERKAELEALKETRPNCYVVQCALPLVNTLTDEGKRQALKIGQQLAGMINPRLHVTVLSSPAQRCVETANGIIAGFCMVRGGVDLGGPTIVDWLSEEPPRGLHAACRLWFSVHYQENHGIVMVTHADAFFSLTGNFSDFGQIGGLLEHVR